MQDNKFKYRLFGRTKGRSKKKINIENYLSLLEKYNIKNIGSNSKLILDIGTGYGETTIFLSKNFLDYKIIAFEKYIDGNLNLLKEIQNQKIKNIYIYPGNVLEFLEIYRKEDNLESVWVFFPDPWHKKKHFKRRLINTNFLKKIHKSLKKNGEIHIATDSQSYIRAIFNIFFELQNLFIWKNQNNIFYGIKDYYDIETKFYKKAIISGKKPSLFILKKI